MVGGSTVMGRSRQQMVGYMTGFSVGGGQLRARLCVPGLSTVSLAFVSNPLVSPSNFVCLASTHAAPSWLLLSLSLHVLGAGRCPAD